MILNLVIVYEAAVRIVSVILSDLDKSEYLNK